MITLIRIGNSQGIRIPKAITEQARFADKQLEFKVIDDGLLIQSVKMNKAGWKEQFDQTLKSQKSSEADQVWLDAPLVDEEDWEW